MYLVEINLKYQQFYNFAYKNKLHFNDLQIHLKAFVLIVNIANHNAHHDREYDILLLYS